MTKRDAHRVGGFLLMAGMLLMGVGVGLKYGWALGAFALGSALFVLGAFAASTGQD